jgi:hypothetical protein
MQGVGDYFSLIQSPSWPFPLSDGIRDKISRHGIENLADTSLPAFFMEFHICLPWELDGRSKVRKSSCQMPHPADFVLSIQTGQPSLNLESNRHKTRYMLDILHSFSRTVKVFTTSSQSTKNIRAPFMSSRIFLALNADGGCLPRTAMLNRNFLRSPKGPSSQPWGLAITRSLESHRMYPFTNRGAPAHWYRITLSPRSQ